MGLDWLTACPFGWKCGVLQFLWIRLSGFLHPQLPTALSYWRRQTDRAAREECHVLEQAFIPVPTLLPGCCQYKVRNVLGTTHQLDTCVGQGQNPQKSDSWQLQQQKSRRQKRHHSKRGVVNWESRDLDSPNSLTPLSLSSLIWSTGTKLHCLSHPLEMLLKPVACVCTYVYTHIHIYMVCLH